MIQVRKSKERGHANHGWLDSYHTFSFSEYYDSKFMGFRSLRVINEDRIEGGAGFPLHPHQDMEIVTILLDGALEHKDTLGNTSVIRPGEVQRMTAGTGIRHSEFNHLSDQLTHLLQIWILPERSGLEPGYEQKDFRQALESKPLTLVASRDGREGSVTIHQDANLYWGKLDKKHFELRLPLAVNRGGWLQVMHGEVRVGDRELTAGDGAAFAHEKELTIQSQNGSTELLFFDLA